MISAKVSATFLLSLGDEGPSVLEFTHPALRMALVDRNQVAVLDATWNKAGIYFLLGPGSEPSLYAVYVGKAPSGARSRVLEQVREKDWWARALVVESNHKQDFTSAEVSWLEGRFHQLLTEHIKTSVRNKVKPGDNTLKEWEVTNLEYLVQPVQAVLRVLGALTSANEPELVKEETSTKVSTTKSGHTHTWLEAAEIVLKTEGAPMKSGMIVAQALKLGLRQVGDARTPEATLGRDLREAIKRKDPRFQQTGPATFALASHATP